MTIKTIIAPVILTFLSITTSAQVDIKKMVDSLQYLKTDSLDCSAGIYWRIVAQKEKAVPFLIDKLTDLTPTNLKDRCKVTPLNVSEVAYYALTEIADFPIFLVTHMQFDHLDEKGCSGFHQWYFFSDSIAHKQAFQDNVRSWWAGNFNKYRWTAIRKKDLSFCQLSAGITGYYKWVGR